MENAAGQKEKIGGSFEELRWLLDEVMLTQLGWCLDTCHMFAAGYDLKNALDEMKRLKLLDTLRCIHVNDSRDPFDSSRDRHANLGDGQIPAADLKAFLNSPELA